MRTDRLKAAPAASSRGQDDLLRENRKLRRRLEIAEDTVRALRAGEADAVMVGMEPEQVYTLEKADQPYRLVVGQLPQGAATLTIRGELIYCNAHFAKLIDRPLNELRGQSIDALVAPESRSVMQAMVRDGANGETRADLTLTRPDGGRVPVYLAISPLREGPLGLCLMLTDLTQQRHYEELQVTQAALRASEERLELAQRAGRIGTFEWDIRTGAVTWSATKEALYGLPPGSFRGRYEDWRDTVHPDDRARAEADRRRAVAERTELESEFRIIRPDGEIRWIASTGKVMYDENGQPSRLLGVSQDITERKRTEEELRNADRKKDEFLATLAHELRNPLAPIRNAVQILKTKGPQTPDLVWGRDVLDRQVQLMARLLEDLLDVSRISRNQLELRRERIDLATIVEMALETSAPAIEADGHELAVDLPPEPVYLDADPMRLAQVLANLLNNAAKYTEPGGRIRVAAERCNGEVTLSVADSGIGITAEALPRIFEIFSQATPALVRAQGGLGVGLSLVKGLVELHGGSIEARSTGPGQGSCFVVRLPVATGSPEHQAPAEAETRSQALQRKFRILIVDDNRDSADSLSELLRIMEHEVGTAYDGEHAVRAAENLRPDVALLDIGMPKLNGYEACRHIRQQPWGRDMYVIALTGWGREEDRDRTEEAGFDAHLVKPVDPATLVQLLDRIEPRDDRREASADPAP